MEGVEEWLTCNQVVKGSNNGSRDYLMDMKVILRKECRDMRIKAGRRAWVCLDRECKDFLRGKVGRDTECLDSHQGKVGRDTECLGSHQGKAGKGSGCLIHRGKVGKGSGYQVSQGKVVQDSGGQVFQGKVDQVSHLGEAAVKDNSKDSGLLAHHLQTEYRNILVLHCSQ